MLHCNNDLVIWFHCLVAQTNPSLVAPRWVFYLSVRYNNKLLKIYLRLEQLNQGIWKRLDSIKDPYLRKNADTLQILINNAFANDKKVPSSMEKMDRVDTKLPRSKLLSCRPSVRFSLF